MKKIIIGLFIFMVSAVLLNEKENLLIPDNAIRFRVIANSDTKFDQDLKMTIKNEVEKELYKIIGNIDNIDEVRKVINNNLEQIDNIVKKYNVTYDISFGNNFFPEKEYKGVKYQAGNYESLVIKLGSGEGQNWWCVLFPPLCLLDENKNLENAEYELYAAKIINKFK